MRADLPNRLPEDIDAERSFLATVCAPGAGIAGAEAVAGLAAEDFVHPAHRAVFRAVKVLLDEGLEISSLTLKDALTRTKELDRAGGFTGLVELLAGEDVERPQLLGEIIQRKSRLRKLVHAGAELMRLAATEEDTPDALLSLASTRLAELSLAKKGKGLRFTAEIGNQAMDRISATLEGRKIPSVSTGFPKLDRFLKGGFKPGKLIVLAARPGIGKSTMARGWARRSAALAGPAALFSLEMSSGEIWEALASNQSGIDSERLGLGELAPHEWARLQTAKEDLDALPLLVDDQAEITVAEIRGRVDRAIARHGHLSLIIVDYLQLISSPKGSDSKNEAVRIAEISRGLKLMAKDAGVPVVILSQLNREIEHGKGRRPQLSDLRDSGAIEQDADTVIFIHRSGEGEDARYELVIPKNRDGKTGTVPLEADMSTYTFRESEQTTLQMAACAPLARPKLGRAQ